MNLLATINGKKLFERCNSCLRAIGRLLFFEQKLATMMVKEQLKSGRFLKDGDVVRCSLKSADGRIDCGEG